MTKITVDLHTPVKKMKPMHGGGQPPLGGAGMTEYFHYLTEAGIPFSRLHDVGGVFGGGRFVDVPNLFRDFDADETDPRNYDFAFTDLLIKALVDAGVEPYFRLGTTIENQALVKAYRIYPPKDSLKWARICEHIIRHYTEGWADGFRYDIRYWEIWNEPEVQDRMMWMGTDEEYYELYDVAARHLKACFPHLKIGGYASCGFYAVAPAEEIDPVTRLPGTIPPSEHEKHLLTFFYGFFDYIRKHSSPIDFFSWHSYADVSRVRVMDRWLHEELEKLGYGGLETHLNEWNPYPTEYGTAHHSAEVAAMMIALQNGYTDAMMIYDMRTSTAPYCPLFDIKTNKPIHAYYALAAFNELYKLGTEVECSSGLDRLYALAASNGKKHALLLSNLTGRSEELSFEGVNLGDSCVYELGDSGKLAWAPNAGRIEQNGVMLILFR